MNIPIVDSLFGVAGVAIFRYFGVKGKTHRKMQAALTAALVVGALSRNFVARNQHATEQSSSSVPTAPFPMPDVHEVKPVRPYSSPHSVIARKRQTITQESFGDQNPNIESMNGSLEIHYNNLASAAKTNEAQR